MELKKITRGMIAAACLVAGTAQAGSVTYDLTAVATQQSDLLDLVMSFQQFNPSLGTLTGVTLDIYSDIAATVSLTNNNTGANGGRTVNVDLPATLSLAAPASSTLSASGTLLQTDLHVGAKVGSIAGQASESDSLTLHASDSYAGAALAAFSGTGTLDSQLTVKAGSSLQVNKVQALYNTTANGYGQVTYTFTALPVPEPETYGMLLAGLALVGVVAKRSKRAA